ncbi:hypothetical protein CK203_004468 [Vitis vinifera]|uniref:Reverse transcriptase zinc-binding domain-containing protein n=1 Tax=Vitis vinifera TaxID=29760 RepID=A0A438KFH5_VITVI|nr:hypothetical protein CK203_004468 [Vitis vinifera]
MERKKVGGGPVKLEVGMESVFGNSLGRNGLDSGSLGTTWGEWSLEPLLLTTDWEVDEVGDLFVKLQGKAVDMAEEDKMVWMNLHNLNFSVKLLYATLESRVIMSFPRQVVWNLWVPSKVNFFAWEAIWGKVLTVFGQ